METPHPRTLDFARLGLNRARSRPGLIVLIYAAHLLIALGLAVVPFLELDRILSRSGFSAELAQGFDVELLVDVWRGLDALPGKWLLFLVPAVVFVLLWDTFASVGLIHALRREGGGFWRGGLRWVLEAIVLRVLYVIVLGLACALVAVPGYVLANGAGEAVRFWILIVLLPVALVAVVVFFDCMQDYARALLVTGRAPLFRAWISGFAFPFRRLGASRLYLLWAGITLAAWIVTWLIGQIPVRSVWGSVFLFGSFQVAFLARSAILVSWLGSEVALVDSLPPAALPTEPEEEAAFSVDGTDEPTPETELAPDAEARAQDDA